MRSACVCCRSAELEPLLRLENVPVLCNALHRTPAEARAAPRAAIDLVRCRSCGHVLNRDFDSRRTVYGPTYENSLQFSTEFRRYAEGLARRLIDRHQLRGKTVVEIGCGDGSFLRLLCEVGGNRGFGFDPARRWEEAASSALLRFSAGDFSAGAVARPDLLCCRHVLEHLAEPAELLRTVRAALPLGAVVFIEVPNGEHLGRAARVWDVVYEHPSHFGAASLAALLRATGFTPTEVQTAFGHQFLCLEGEAGASPAGAGVANPGESFQGFGERCRRQLAAWADRLRAWRDGDRRVALWGAGSKGVTFLNLVAPAGEVAGVVDVNPRKQGSYVTGTGHPIRPVESLRELRPDVVVITNPVYEPEVAAALREMALPAEVVCA